MPPDNVTEKCMCLDHSGSVICQFECEILLTVSKEQNTPGRTSKFLKNEMQYVNAEYNAIIIYAGNSCDIILVSTLYSHFRQSDFIIFSLV